MKKIFSTLMLSLAVLGLSSCSPETDVEAGGTAVQDMAGIWDVTLEAFGDDGNGNIVSYGDAYGVGPIQIYTFNTNDNDPDMFYITDNGEFWDFKFKCGLNYGAKTFACDPVAYSSESDGETATVSNGKVLLGAAKNLHGMPNDSIVFDVKFSDDDPSILFHRISGQRYTGFYE